jgi:hypothetical protein
MNVSENVSENRIVNVSESKKIERGNATAKISEIETVTTSLPILLILSLLQIMPFSLTHM